jgi:hypothetical protein
VNGTYGSLNLDPPTGLVVDLLVGCLLGVDVDGVGGIADGAGDPVADPVDSVVIVVGDVPGDPQFVVLSGLDG